MKLTREEAAQRFINDGSATLDHKLTAYGNFKKWCADHDIEIIQTVYRIETLEFVDTPEEKASYENSNGDIDSALWSWRISRQDTHARRGGP